jgi:hypothetical protein
MLKFLHEQKEFGDSHKQNRMEIVILALLWWAVEMTNPKNNNQ